MSKKILLLDVSHLFFRAFFAIPRNLTDANGEVINAVFGVSSILLSVLESENPQYVFGAKDEKEKTKRHEVMPEYKGHRPEMPSELVSQLPKIFDIFEAFSIPLLSKIGYEADDVLATISERYRGNSEFEVEIVSGDHDVFQLVGENVFVGLPQNGNKAPLHLERQGIFEKIGVYPEQVADFKALVGDPSDNMKGVPGVGKKTAEKLLAEYGTLEKILENSGNVPGKLGEKLIDGKEIAAITKRMALLHRDIPLPQFDLEQGSVKNISKEKLDRFFREYQFHSLLNRMPRIFSGNNKASSQSVQEEELWEELEEAKKGTLSVLSKKEDESGQMALF